VEVRLSGDAADLERLSRIADTPALNVEDEGDTYVLTSIDLDDLDDAEEVFGAGELRLAALAAILMIQHRGGRSVAVSGVRDARGKHLVIGMAEMRLRLGRPDPDEEARAWTAAARDPHGPVARAFRAFRRGTGADLANVLEIIAHDVGGGIDELARRGWAPAGELRRFMRGIQFYESAGDEARHSRARGEPPPEPLAMREARRLVRRVLESWLDHGPASQ
jgi:hypothetical protein